MPSRSAARNLPTVFDRIIIGYAGDQAGRDAVALGDHLTALLGSGVTVVFPYKPLLARVSADVVEQRVRQEVEELTADVGGLAVTSCHWTPSSWPIHGLHEMARYEQADLIVLGSACEGLAGHLHVSLMERLVHGAPCAVAVAPAQYSDVADVRFSRVGVGFSSSDDGIAALHLAREFAARAGAHLDVIAGAGADPILAGYVFATSALPEFERELYDETKAVLERTVDELEDGVPLERETIRGDPADALIERSSELDILVLGSRAYGPVRHVLLGSVSSRVMREARCPVLVLPRGVDSGGPVATCRESADD
jgi:nucleotide-binding universal stress UspA family protein